MEEYTSPEIWADVLPKKYQHILITLGILGEILSLFTIGVIGLRSDSIFFTIFIIITCGFVAVVALVAVILIWIDRDGSRSLRKFKESFTKKMKTPKVVNIYIGVYKNRPGLIIQFVPGGWGMWLVNVAIPYDVGIKLLDAYFKRNARHSKIRTEKNRIAVEFPELGETYFFDKKYIKDIIFIKTIVEDQYDRLKKIYESLEPLKYHYYVMRGFDWMGFEMKKFS